MPILTCQSYPDLMVSLKFFKLLMDISGDTLCELQIFLLTVYILQFAASVIAIRGGINVKTDF